MAVLVFLKGNFTPRNMESNLKQQYLQVSESDKTDMNYRDSQIVNGGLFGQDKSSDIRRVTNSMDSIMETISSKNERSVPVPEISNTEDKVFGQMVVKMISSTEEPKKISPKTTYSKRYH